MRLSLAIVPLAVIGIIGVAYAQPLEQVDYRILDIAGSDATVQLSWNNDNSASKYEAGCVSCIPNQVKETTDNAIVLENISTLEDGHALLFVVAYDDLDNIIGAKQVFLKIR